MNKKILKTFLLQTCIVFIALMSHQVFSQDIFSSDKDSSSIESGEPEFLKVDEAYQVLPTLKGDSIDFQWNIEPGYYLYKHQFKVEVQNDAEKAKPSQEFQKGKLKFDEIFNKEVEVYYKSTSVLAKGISFKPPYQIKLTSQGCADAGLCYPPRKQYFQVDAGGSIVEIEKSQYKKVSGSASSSNAASDGTQSNADMPADEEAPTLIFVILGAVLGGLILNLMPCVFPVLSLKALSFASHNMNSHKQHLHGWAYTAGVTGSFVAAALVIIIARGAGEQLGWGFQLQSPAFVAFMAYLFFVMGLSLSGMVHFGTQFMGAGQNLTQGEGLKSSFFTGVLAALVASPCTAPFMATALGYALTQPPYISLIIFVALGLGMALPFLLLSYSPVLAKFLPAPGAWMDTLKQVLAFPLYLTSVWLLWVLSNQASSTGAMVILAGAVLITFGIWLLQQHLQTKTGKNIAKGLSVVSIVSACYFAWTVDMYSDKHGSMWETYSPARLEELRTQGTPVFVDLTADWCITCKFNERVALNREEIASFASSNDIVMLQGDWTNSDPVISALLEEFGRSGVPLYLMYPAKANTAPEVLPQILTLEIVLDAMKTAVE